MSVTDNSKLTTYANDKVTIEGKTFLHVHNYSLLCYDIKDGAPTVNILDPYPKLHNYHIIIDRKCHSIEDCEATARFTHIHVLIHKMTYEKFVKDLGKFEKDWGGNGQKIINRFRREVGLYVLEKRFRENIEPGSDEAHTLLTFPNFLLEIPSEAEWNATFPDGQPREGLFLE
jgi:hypothetical protein